MERIRATHVITFTITALVATALVFGIPILLFLESFSAPGSLAEHISPSRGDPDTQITLILHDFDPESRILHVSAHVNVSASFVTSYPENAQPKTLFVFSGDLTPRVFPLSPIPGTIQQYDAFDMTISLNGDPTRYPWDSYRSGVAVGVPAPANYYVNSTEAVTAPMLVTADIAVRREFAGFSSSYSGISHSGINEFTIELERTMYSRVEFLVSTFFFLGFALMIFVASLTDIGRERSARLGLLLGLAAIAVALPGIRDMLVPSDIEVRTVVDAVLLIPFLGFSILTAAVIAFRTLREVIRVQA